MKSIRWAIPVLVLFMMSAVAVGDPVDPSIIIRGGGGSFGLTGSTFTIGTVNGTSPAESPCFVGDTQVADCVFQNATGSGWSTLVFVVNFSSPPVGIFACGFEFDIFSSCSVDVTATSATYTFSGGTGIRAGQEFVFDVLGWAAGTTFDGTATLVVAEPASLILALIGLTGVELRRRRFLARFFGFAW